MEWLEYNGNDENHRPSQCDEYVVWLDHGYWSTAMWDGDGFGESIDEHVTHYMLPTEPSPRPALGHEKGASEMWTVEESNVPGLYDVYDEDGNRVVRHATHDRAILIAKAPDLRAALEEAIALLRIWEAHLEVSDPTLERDRVIGAIKQAHASLTGEAGDE